MRNTTRMLMLILSAAVASCGDGPRAAPDSPLTPAEFIEVVVGVREAEREVVAGDSASQRFQERRQEVLDRHGTTEAELRAFLATNAENLPLLEEVWDTINARLTFVPEDGEMEGEEDDGEDDGEEEAEDDIAGEGGPGMEEPVPVIR